MAEFVNTFLNDYGWLWFVLGVVTTVLLRVGLIIIVGE